MASQIFDVGLQQTAFERSPIHRPASRSPAVKFVDLVRVSMPPFDEPHGVKGLIVSCAGWRVRRPERCWDARAWPVDLFFFQEPPEVAGIDCPVAGAPPLRATSRFKSVLRGY